MKWVHSLFCYTLNSSVPLVCFHFKLLTLGDRKTLSHIHSICFLWWPRSWCGASVICLTASHFIFPITSLPPSPSLLLPLSPLHLHSSHTSCFPIPLPTCSEPFPPSNRLSFFSISVSHIKRKWDYWHLKRFYWAELSHQFPQLKFKWEENSRLHCRIFMGCKWAGKYIVTNDTSNCVQQHCHYTACMLIGLPRTV